MNLVNEFLGSVIQGQVIKNSKYIPAIHNIDRSYSQTENPDVINMFKKNSIMTSTWHLVNQSFLTELDQIQLKELDEIIRIESIWKSIQLDNKNGNGRWIKFNYFYQGFDYDGLIYTISQNVTYKGYVPPKGCPYIGQFLMDMRCRYYYNQTMGNYSTIVFNPSLLYTDVTPLILQPFCKRRLKYESADPNSKSTKYSILCLTLDLTSIPKYFENFGKNSKLQFVLNPSYLTVVYNSEQNLKRTQVVTIKDIETQYLQDQNQANYFINNITQNNDFIKKNTSQVSFADLFIFSISEQHLFEYNRNGTEYLVIKNTVNIIDKLPKYEYQRVINPAPKFQVKNTFLFLDILSKEKMKQYSITIQEQIKEYNLLFSYISLGITLLVLIIHAKYSLKFGTLFLKPVIHLTKILNQMISQNNDQKRQVRDSMIQYLPTIEDINKDMWIFDELNNYDSQQQEQCQKESCFSSDTQQLLDSFQNLFKVLAFTTQNLYKDNESTSLIRLNIQIQYFDKFRNSRALGVCYNNIGVIHYKCGRFQEAIENFQKSIVFAKYELGFYEHEMNEIEIINHIRDHLNITQVFQQNNEQDKAQHQFKLKRDQKYNDQKEDNILNLEKVELFWNLYNRILNQLKAVYSFAMNSKEIYFQEVLIEQFHELISISKQYLPHSNKRFMYECYIQLLLTKTQNSLFNSFEVLDQFINFYLSTFLKNDIDKTEMQRDNSFYENLSTYKYQDQFFKFLESPIQNKKNRQSFQKSLIDSYKNYKNVHLKQILKVFFQKLSQSKIQNLSDSESFKSKFLNSIQQGIRKGHCRINQKRKSTRIESFSNQKCYFQVRKLIDQFKLCRYEFNSDIFFQYYALEQAQHQIILKNYKNAGSILTNLLEKCVLYLPHLKKQALNLLNKLFMQQNINNPELCQILNKYLIFPHTYFRICTVQACQSKYSLFRSYTIQSDLIKEILFKEQDQIGLLNYSFGDNHYTQLSQFINLKTLNSNLEIFENIFIKLFLEKLFNKDLKSLEKYGINNQSEIQQPYQSQSIFQQNRIQQTKSNFQDCQQKTIQKQDQNRDSLNKPISNEQKNLKDSFNTQFEEIKLSENKIKSHKNFSFAQKLQQRLKVTMQHSINIKNKYQNLQLSQFNQGDSLLNPDSLLKKYTFSPIKNNFKTYKIDNQKELIKIGNFEQIISNNIISENKLSDFSSKFTSQNKYEFSNYDSAENIINKSKFQISEKYNNFILENQSFQTNLISNFVKQSNLGESFSGSYFESIDNNTQGNSMLKSFQNSNFIEVIDSLKQSSTIQNKKYVQNKLPNEESICNSFNNDQVQQYQIIQSNQQQTNSQIFLNKNQQKLTQKILQSSQIDQLDQSQNKKINKTIQKQDNYNQEQNKNALQSQINSSVKELQNPYQESLLNQTQISKNSSFISGEFSFHQGIQAAIKQFILNTNEKISYYLSEKKHKETGQKQKDLSQQEYTDFKNIYFNQKPVITFFSTEEKLLQYIYNSREHLKNYLYPMIYEHF
ncbi:hypothetical protein ABPG72_022710 [Tetrahymena utriculariae]